MISNIKIIILIFVISLFYTIIEGYTPSARYGHSSIILGNKLYFLGGYVKEEENGKELNTNDFFYIDLSKSFDRLNPQYAELTKIASPPVRFSQSSLVPNSQGNGFYVIGGEMNDINDFNKSFYDHFIYEYDEDIKIWNVPKIFNSPNSYKLMKFNSVYDQNNDKTYIFGGINSDNNNSTLISVMQIFDSESLIWSLTLNDILDLEVLFGYTATLLPNGNIVYIGGDTIESLNVGRIERNSLSDIYMYETIDGRWNHIKTDAQGIDQRHGHTAVLASDNRIIVYGGARDDNYLIEAFPQLIVLDTNSFKWLIPDTTRIKPRVLHTANMISDYMIVSFGKILNPSNSLSGEIQMPLLNPSNNLCDEIQILNTRTYEWVNSIQHYVKKDEPTKEPKNPFFKLPRYIQAIIYCAAGLIIITILVLTYYSIKRKYEAKKLGRDIIDYKP